MSELRLQAVYLLNRVGMRYSSSIMARLSECHNSLHTASATFSCELRA